ncbi:MAG: hypothetical protein ACXQTP_01605 [Candidatus Methanofastidiosia archaeon]
MKRFFIITALIIIFIGGCINQNAPPKIEDSFPQENNVYVEPYNNITFSINAVDSENDTLTYQWFLDEKKVGNNTQMTQTFVHEGNFQIRIVVDDGNNSVENIWNINCQIDIEKVEETVSKMRQLDFLYKVPYRKITRKEFSDFIEKELESQNEEFEISEKVFRAFHVWDERNLWDEIVLFYSAGVEGYYNSEDKEYVVVKDSEKNAAVEKMTMSHELTHALQDQHFGLSKVKSFSTNDDNSLAIQCLIEGDASYVESKFTSTMNILEIQSIYKYYSQYEEELNPFLSKIVLFPYIHGQQFVLYIVSNYGWDTLNDVYTNPPRSTEQIIHPEKYIAGEDPVELGLPNVYNINKIDENVVGEALLQIILDEYLDNQMAKTASAGWAGDVYGYYENDDTYLLIYVSQWDTLKDADEFFKAYYDNVEKWSPEEMEIIQQTKDYVVVSSCDTFVLLKMIEDKVFIAQSNSFSNINRFM